MSCRRELTNKVDVDTTLIIDRIIGIIGGVDVENAAFCLLIRRRELYLSINPTGSDQSRVQSVDSVRCHDHLH